MKLEIERKFLVKGNFDKQAVRNVRIRQSYLSTDPQRTVRLRIAGENAWITIKSNSGEGSFSRGEWEIELPFKEALEIMEICVPGRIDKTRYYIPVDKHTFEVDVFHGKNEGLVIAEVELSSEGEVFEAPVWLGEEVTGNPAYYNSNLIK